MKRCGWVMLRVTRPDVACEAFEGMRCTVSRLFLRGTEGVIGMRVNTAGGQ